MLDPATCLHNQACRTFEQLVNGIKVYGFGCPDCGLKVTAGTWENARTIFRIRAERIAVRDIARRRREGASLTEREKLMIAHSPFGDAHAHNF